MGSCQTKTYTMVGNPALGFAVHAKRTTQARDAKERLCPERVRVHSDASIEESAKSSPAESPFSLPSPHLLSGIPLPICRGAETARSITPTAIHMRFL